MTQLTDLQIAVMRVLWERGEATVADVHGALAEERGLAPTTIATLLSRLEKRGLVSHRTAGRQYVYAPEVSEDAVRSSALDALAERLFDGDVGALVSHLLQDSEVAPGDVDRVRRIVEEARDGD